MTKKEEQFVNFILNRMEDVIRFCKKLEGNKTVPAELAVRAKAIRWDLEDFLKRLKNKA